MSNKKVTHLTSAHLRYDPRIFIRMCSTLATQGYAVSLVVADGKGDEVKNRVSIIDVGCRSSGRFTRMTKTVSRVLVKAREIDADIYHLHDPELMPVGLLLKVTGKHVIFDMHENLSLQVMQKTWIPCFLRKFISRLVKVTERLLLPQFNALIVPQKIMIKMYSNLNKSVNCIANYPTTVNLSNVPNLSRKENLLYAGAISVDRGLLNMLNMMVQLPESYTLNLAGPIDQECLKLIETCDAKNRIKYHGSLSIIELNELYQKSGVGLIMFNNVGQYYMANSLKLFEYLQNGLFVLMPDFGEWVDFNKCYSVGINTQVTNAKASAKLLLQLSENDKLEQSIKNQKIVYTEFNWSNEKQKLDLLYKNVAKQKC